MVMPSIETVVVTIEQTQTHINNNTISDLVLPLVTGMVISQLLLSCIETDEWIHDLKTGLTRLLMWMSGI